MGQSTRSRLGEGDHAWARLGEGEHAWARVLQLVRSPKHVRQSYPRVEEKECKELAIVKSWHSGGSAQGRHGRGSASGSGPHHLQCSPPRDKSDPCLTPRGPSPYPCVLAVASKFCNGGLCSGIAPTRRWSPAADTEGVGTAQRQHQESAEAHGQGAGRLGLLGLELVRLVDVVAPCLRHSPGVGDNGLQPGDDEEEEQRTENDLLQAI
jgi:hypothetical protein